VRACREGGRPCEGMRVAEGPHEGPAGRLRRQGSCQREQAGLAHGGVKSGSPLTQVDAYISTINSDLELLI
jgi:hypothetical protein